MSSFVPAVELASGVFLNFLKYIVKIQTFPENNCATFLLSFHCLASLFWIVV